MYRPKTNTAKYNIYFTSNRLFCIFQLLTKLKSLNDNPDVHGIIVQMPLDSDNKIDSHLVTDSVDPSKDVDG